jgi:hypothetical protein
MVSRQKSKPYKNYKSPLRKLVRFFEQSRDRWKKKYQEAKRLLKRLKNRIRFLEESRDRWKGRTKELERELGEVKAKAESLKKELEGIKQKPAEVPKVLGGLDNFSLVPAHHHYSVGHVELFLALVLSAAVSLRGTSRVFEIVGDTLGLPWTCPSWSAGRLWLLRVGYYKLTRPKQQAADWVWIVDHSIQLGLEKCLVILGVRLSELPPPERCLEHKDVEPIAMFPVKKSNGDVVYQQLEETIEQTGVPREIVGDKGSDLQAGIRQFCQAHPETDYIYDIKHKTAAVLRRELAADPAWLEFKRLAAQTKSQVQQTRLAPLAPPKQKSKARYMNLEPLVAWGQKIIVFVDKHPTEREDQFDPSQVKKKLGWVTGFRVQLAEWGQLLSDIIITESFVRKEGLYHGTCQALKEQLPILEVETERTKKVRQQLLDFVAAEEAKAKPNERLLGSSEVLESVFGKLKRMEKDQAKSGFTGLLLSVAAMVSNTTTDGVQKALETVPTKTVLAWCQEKLGKSVQAQRREAFASEEKTEQKRDRLRVPI